MKHRLLKYFLLFFLLQNTHLQRIQASPDYAGCFDVKPDTNQPGPRVVLLLVNFRQGEKGITVEIVQARLAEGILKQRVAIPYSGKATNLICYVYNTRQQIVDSVEILQPLMQHYEYPITDSTMGYKQIEFKEQPALLRFKWQPGLKSLVLFQHRNNGNNKPADAIHEILLPVSITQPVQ